MPRNFPIELHDPRSVRDPAWGGLRSTHAEVDEVGFGDDLERPRDDFGEEVHGRFDDVGVDADPGERMRGRFWRSRRKRARDVMTPRPRTAGPDATLEELARVMRDEDCGVLPIVDGERLIGVVTDRDLVCRTVARGLPQSRARATDVMSDELATVEEGANLGDVLREMERHRVRRICVVDEDDRLRGIISMADLAREADIDFELQDAFLEISSERSFWERLR